MTEPAYRVPDQVLRDHQHPTSPKRARLRDAGRTFAESDVKRVSSNKSGRSDEAMARIRKLQKERTTFLTQEDKSWMHTLLPSSHHSWINRCSTRLPGSKLGDFSSVRKTTDLVSKLVRHPGYQLARGMMMVLDAVLVVWEMQYAAQRATSGIHNGLGGIEDATMLSACMDISCVIFVTDLLLGCTAGLSDPTISTGHGWQYFHVVVVIAQLFQTIGQHSHRHQRSYSQFRVVLAMLSTLRLARLLSLVLVTDVIRQHRFFRELRIMVHALAGAVKVLLWSSLLIFMILLIFGTVLSEGALAFLIRNEVAAADAPGGARPAQGAPAELQGRFGSLFGAVLTLFQSMSGGLDWEQAWQAVGVLGWGYRSVYLLFICFSLFAMLNVVTAVFIESTMARSMSDRGLVVQNELMEKKDFLTGMRTIFRELDVDADGELTNEELRRRMLEPEIGAYFSQLGMDVDEVGKLFFLLDRDKSGAIDPEEFMFGCLKFRGEAKSLDIAVMHQQVLWIHEALKVVVSALGISDSRVSHMSVASSRGLTSEAPNAVPPGGADGAASWDGQWAPGSAKSAMGSWDLSSECGMSPTTSPARSPVAATSPHRARRLPEVLEAES